MAKKTFIREISFEAQSGSRVLVRYNGLLIRGVSYRGQAWFDVTDGQIDFPTKDFDRSHQVWIYREGSLSVQDNVSRAAIDAARVALLDEARAWVALPAATELLRQAEIERLKAKLTEALTEAKRLAAAVEVNREESRALLAQLNQLT